MVEAHRFVERAVALPRLWAMCPSCGHDQAADYPTGLEPERVFGPQVETLVTYFHHVHHLSVEESALLSAFYERLEQVLEEVFGLKISQGAIDNILQRTAQRLEPESEKIRQTYHRSRVVGSMVICGERPACDETGVRMDGQNYWQWVFQTPQASYYVIAPAMLY